MGFRNALSRKNVLGRAIARTVVFNFANALAAGLGGIIVARALGPAGRGDYATAMSWFGIALILGELGQTAAVVYFASRDPDAGPDVLATAARKMLKTGFIATVAAGFAALTHGVGTTGFWTYLVLALTLPVWFVSAPYIYALQAKRISAWNWARSVQPYAWLMLLATSSLVIDLSLPAVLGFLLASAILQGGVAWWICRRLALTGGRHDPALARPMLSYGLSNLSSVLPTSMTRHLDVLVLGAFVVSTQVGYYSVAMSFTLLALPIASAIGSVLFPAHALAGPARRIDIRRYLVWTVMPTLFAAVPLVALSPWLLPLIYGDAYRPAVPLVLILMPALLAVAVNQVGGDVLRGLGHPRRVARASWAGLIAMLALLAAMVPFWGVLGAAVAASAAQCVGMLVLFLQFGGLAESRRVREVPAEETSEL